MNDIYSEIILDYYKYPRNKGPLPDATNSAQEDNPLCGDKISMHLKIADNKIIDIKFEGEGCAISQAATSMLTEDLKGKSLEYAQEFSNDQMIELLNIPISPGRMKCALLGLKTTKQALNNG